MKYHNIPRNIIMSLTYFRCESIDATDMVVHVIDRWDVERSDRPYDLEVKTYCGCKVDLRIFDAQCERKETDVNCDLCVAEVERQQASWNELWSSPKGIRVIKILTGYDKIERQQAELDRQIQALIRSTEEFNDLLTSCLKHKEPVFTLELPDEILLKLVSYSCVGEVLLAFKMDADTRQNLEAKLGKVGFNLLGSRMISKGYLKANDPIFQNWK